MPTNDHGEGRIGRGKAKGEKRREREGDRLAVSELSNLCGVHRERERPGLPQSTAPLIAYGAQ